MERSVRCFGRRASTRRCSGDQLSPDEAELKQQTAPLQRIVLNFVLIPMSLPLLRQFQRLCGSELRMVALRSLCVRRIGRYLLGETGGVLDDSAARTSRLAVPLERETPKGQHIYCVLAANTRKDVPVPWYLDGLCYPGQEDEKGYGRWLCQTFGLPNEETEQGRPSAPFPPDGADLLERAAQGSCSLGEVLTGFEAPDLLDSAVMLGRTETVRALIDTPGEAERLGLTAAELEAALETMSEPEGSVTLCSAGRRLWRALGGRRGQAERCFLTALLLGDPAAVSGLLDVYRGEGRIQEVLVLFDRWRDAMDGRIWRGCMDCLLPTGVVDVGWAVGEDVLYFLSPPPGHRQAEEAGGGDRSAPDGPPAGGGHAPSAPAGARPGGGRTPGPAVQPAAEPL